MAHVQIRNVPDEVHRALKARAALAGMSLSEFLLLEVQRMAATPSLAELADRVRERGLIDAPEPAAEAVRRDRDAR